LNYLDYFLPKINVLLFSIAVGAGEAGDAVSPSKICLGKIG